jgi:hypothetical protein
MAGGMRDAKVGANVVHRQNGLNLSACVRKAKRAHVGPGFQPNAT